MCVGRPAIDLLAQLADEDVDGPVAVALAAAPQLLQQLVSADHAAALQRQRVEDAELGRSQPRALAVDVRLHLLGVDAQLLDLDRLAVLAALGSGPSPRGGPDAGDELLHREGLDEVVVRPDLEGVHAVVLGAAGADDHDRSPDALFAGLLDESPPVEPRQHEVDDAHVRVLEAQPRQARLTVVDDDRLEARSRQVTRHALGDDVVVLDDQDLRHTGPR